MNSVAVKTSELDRLEKFTRLGNSEVRVRRIRDKEAAIISSQDGHCLFFGMPQRDSCLLSISDEDWPAVFAAFSDPEEPPAHSLVTDLLDASLNLEREVWRSEVLRRFRTPRWLAWEAVERAKRAHSLVLRPTSPKPLTEKAFLGLVFDANPVNQRIRENHLVAFQGAAAPRKVSQIIEFLEDKRGLAGVPPYVGADSKLREELWEPIYWNHEFWRKGSNFFLNPAFFGFRKGVLPYLEANTYIASWDSSKPDLYSGDYYASLPEMSDQEIERFLSRSPIEIGGNKLLSGRHRVAAMVGRIVLGKPYIPMYSSNYPLP